MFRKEIESARKTKKKKSARPSFASEWIKHGRIRGKLYKTEPRVETKTHPATPAWDGLPTEKKEELLDLLSFEPSNPDELREYRKQKLALERELAKKGRADLLAYVQRARLA